MGLISGLPSSDEMRAVIEMKQELEGSLAEINRQIFELEEQYIAETPHGNVMKGWDGLLDSKLTGASGRKVELQDRIFSHSSYTFWRSLIRQQKEQQNLVNQASSMSLEPNSPDTKDLNAFSLTSIHTPTKQSSGNSFKKKKRRQPSASQLGETIAFSENL